MNPKKNYGFTLIELLVVIGILTILLSIVLVALNPARRFNQANNAKRTSDAITILNSISQYREDNKGILPAGITTIEQNISNTGANICADLVGPNKYLPALPQDPESNGGAQITNCSAVYDTKYTVFKDVNGHVTLKAPDAKLGEVISVTR